MSPSGVVTLGADELSFGVASHPVRTGAGPPRVRIEGATPAGIRRVQATRPHERQIAKDLVGWARYSRSRSSTRTSRARPTSHSHTSSRTPGSSRSSPSAGQPLSESVTISAQSADHDHGSDRVRPIPAIAGVARAAMRSSVRSPRPRRTPRWPRTRSTPTTPPAYATRRTPSDASPMPIARCPRLRSDRPRSLASTSSQELEAKTILDDPPDPHFKHVAKPAPVHPKHIKGNRFKAFDALIARPRADGIARTGARDLRQSGERSA